ncbi:MAG: glycosyltransferase family 39 protein, partial [Acidobacteriota bacterium]
MMKRITIIVLFSLLLSSLLLLNQTPFYRDEALYAEIIDEMIAGGGPVPQYAGVPVGWKPPLAFWVYSPIIAVLSPLGLPAEIAYRIPSALIGSLCAALVYLIVGRISKNDDLAFISGLSYAGTALAMLVHRTLLTDSLLSLSLLGSLFCYLRAGDGRKWIFAGGVLGALGVLTKSIAGLFAPALVLAYCFFNDQRRLKQADFLASFLLIPLAFAILLLFPGTAVQYLVDATQRTAGGNIGHSFGVNLMVLLGLTLPWLAICLYGFYRYRDSVTKELFWFAWLILGLYPLA